MGCLLWASGATVPDWAIQISFILVMALVAVLAIRFLEGAG